MGSKIVYFLRSKSGREIADNNERPVALNLSYIKRIQNAKKNAISAQSFPGQEKVPQIDDGHF
jgi:hypothetical protein